MGAVGQEYVHSVLTSMNPQNAVKEIQKHGSFRNKRCKPILELLDQLGLKRCSYHQEDMNPSMQYLPREAGIQFAQLSEQRGMIIHKDSTHQNQLVSASIDEEHQ